MSKQELRDHFWRAGSSSKNTESARAAGVVGTFGIGAMANFGIADALEVVSESAIVAERTRCTAERATLSVTDDCIAFTSEPPTGLPGSVVTATMKPDSSMNVSQAVAYISDFIRFVDLPVKVNGVPVSQTPLEQAVPDFTASWRWSGTAVPLGPSLAADAALTGSGAGDLSVDLQNIVYNGVPIVGRMILRQGAGPLRTFRSRFGLAAASMASSYNLGGVADFLLLQPTAGREAITTQSQAFLNLFAAPIDALLSQHLAERPEANVSQPFIDWMAAHGRWELCGQLRAHVEPGDSAPLAELAVGSKEQPLLIYAGTDSATMKLASAERPLVLLARNMQRRQCEQNYLQKFGRTEVLTDEAKVLARIKRANLTVSQSALLFRLTEILGSDYFLTANIEFGTMSHGLAILVAGDKPVSIVLDPSAANVSIIIQIYEK